ncbi:MAG TPA: hypothetical protein ENK67_02925, partial [Flavobacteriia bacterium]|nr:hypothetical protein [Flavobacteriia bacterium]
KIFLVLTIITFIEVMLGIYKPTSLFLSDFLGTSFLNLALIILTLLKAYFIAWFFMHLRDEKKWFRRSLVWVLVLYISWLTFILINDGNYVRELMQFLSN